MNLPNKLTVLRICVIPIFLVALLGNFFEPDTGRYIALGIFVCASLTDFLDGYIARSRGLVTNFGKLMDPLADKILVASALIALVELGSLPSWLAVTVITREFLVTGIRLIALSENQEMVISAAMPGKIKTVSQMALIIFILLGFTGTIADYTVTVLIWIVIFFTVISAADYMIKNISIFKDI